VGATVCLPFDVLDREVSMRTPLCLILTAGFVLASLGSPLLANDGSDGSTDRLDDAWAERALADPELDRGWCQTGHSDRGDGRAVFHEVREFSYPRVRQPIAIDGGDNGGMTVMGWDRDSVRIVYRVTARAKTEDRARALAAAIQLGLTKGWLRPEGPAAVGTEWWSVEVKAWVPRESNLALETSNGPLGVREVRGTMDLNSINGPMSLVDLAGAVEARVENGPLHVALAGSRWDGAGIDAEAQNGPLNLALPAGYSARLVTGTISGPRSFDYALESRPRQSWITTTLGDGGPRVRVVTNNGPFHIEER